MTYRARVFFEPGSDADIHPLPIGEQELGQRPALNADATFEFRGRPVTARIDVIAPTDWEALGVVPTILVVRSAPD